MAEKKKDGGKLVRLVGMERKNRAKSRFEHDYWLKRGFHFYDGTQEAYKMIDSETEMRRRSESTFVDYSTAWTRVPGTRGSKPAQIWTITM